ncbi:MAG: CDP-diacylglycerol--glycerol-3-phosphate 3-phosphatidyltransferase [Firmicutes bacterium]|jgi:CDP-diacylglycerol--glycerol-3-phosphate 3-phosphatidyltransferase|nr:CDP-diacylglycerol--glycerol-3-phosphate 3-phosphatidyltransferase [Bacillota bacterium]NLL88670.1 CDP-diacylglycerol--glycerol-3-phosphate 3-phosphatidyltransferase [Bacillota bacterium]HKM16917.1 CDP-diacylglycerol--glycerol-3-phosphate 3-phosphatidyltransferase [Limnochordia bacterium]
MGLANWITIIRIFFIPVFMAVLLSGIANGKYWAAIVFGIAAATDGLDGYIARTRKEVTKFGKLIDPIADKLLISAALLTLVELDQLSAWVAVIIIGREFAVSGLRILAAADQVVIAASTWGKVKTLIQIIAIMCLLLEIPHAMMVMWLAVLVTIISGVDYFYRAQDLLKKID